MVLVAIGKVIKLSEGEFCDNSLTRPIVSKRHPFLSKADDLTINIIIPFEAMSYDRFNMTDQVL